MPSVIFVCTGNTCRSPMAEALFRARLRAMPGGDAGWLVESAGTWAQDGSPATRFARETMAQRGLDLSRHKSRTVKAEMLSRFNLILVMETNHKEALRSEFRGLSNRVYLLSEMVGRKLSVEDPVAGTLQDYQFTADEIDAYFARGWQRILELAQP